VIDHEQDTTQLFLVPDAQISYKRFVPGKAHALTADQINITVQVQMIKIMQDELQAYESYTSEHAQSEKNA
jgi:hypothetical protein